MVKKPTPELCLIYDSSKILKPLFEIMHVITDKYKNNGGFRISLRPITGDTRSSSNSNKNNNNKHLSHSFS